MMEKKKSQKDAEGQKKGEEAAPTQDPGMIRVLFIEGTSGEQFESRVPIGTRIDQLAGDFFESQDWQTHDGQGHAQRAVVELVDRDKRDRTQRLRGDHTVEQAGLRDGDIIRIFPEAVAGVVNENARLRTLIQDLNGMRELTEWNRRISFEGTPENAPTKYLVRLDYPGFARLEGAKPIRTTKPHEVEIFLSADYPRTAPIVRWKTEIFHPNIHPEHRGVCLGVLMERWLPGMGIARLVTMLAEIAQWRNFDITNAFNKEASEWAAEPENAQYIEDIEGSPEQLPMGELFKMFEKEFSGRKPIEFRRIGKGQYAGNS
jgi:hypothetical protein